MPSTSTPRLLFRRGAYGLLLFCSGTGAYVYFSHVSNRKSNIKHMNSSTFIPFTLISKEAVSSTGSIFTLQPQQKDPLNSTIIKEAFSKGIWSVQFKQPQLQIARNYTPLPILSSCSSEHDAEQLQVLIRREDGGEVSNYLHDLPEQSTIAVRGPFKEVDIPSNVSRILFLAGGTGIAPALQIAGLLKDRDPLQLQILWANRRREDCVGAPRIPGHLNWSWLTWSSKSSEGHEKPAKIIKLITDLESQASSERLKVNYFVDEENSFIAPRDVAGVLESSRDGKGLIIISGPDGFVDYWAGKKEWRDGHEVQGRIRGQLAKMNTAGWKIIKL